MQRTAIWSGALDEELDMQYMRDLQEFIAGERARGVEVYPPAEEVFSAFDLCPYEKTKVVIIGQDPYHGPGQAHGLAFSVREGVSIPPSLKNIYKELKSDLGFEVPTSGFLERWAREGVLLLNATLTVRRGEPKSHYGKGWERFTSAVVQKLFEREDPMVFLLWGKSAEEKCDLFLGGEKRGHLVLKASHPSPFSAANFLGCKHFSKTNAQLKKWGNEPVKWGIN